MPNSFVRRLFAALIFAQPFLVAAQSLSLTEAEARLEAGNREIIAARQLVELASSGVLLAGAVPNPSFTASVSSISPQRGIGGGRPQDKQVDSIVRLDQLLERGNKRDLRIATADAQVLASQRDLDEVRRQQRLALNVAYFELKLALEKLQIQRETLR
ncbi:MAG: TolC family protein, partial [Burkholderiales bacterium]